ncbi:Cyclic di-GMP phosphodiesterase response regulator RpfG [Rubripirellula obstinata]|uniref:Cyclic di-GMP phosphodiesterase response regulator RpfG n=1 Tax=Rubripirellula obstinata TaxID=406547 RepID=A0A5B1CDZ5_9BACT|nr:HD domain-containing phosphohydrolase [Rubripirellula obstinata]KAA1257574.1 Cyclic di-GMP phosphodiesterase response regulator RpfG [Rubripirellula obstinata]
MFQTSTFTELAESIDGGLSLLTRDLGETELPSFCETKHARTARIMIIDDEMINIEIVQAYLEEEGFRNFLTTTDSTTAVEQIQSEKPDILLLDINMPQVSGLEILEKMRASKELRLVPAIVLTASNDPEVKLKALRLGASDFLAKPVDPSELMLRVQNVLAVKAYQDHLADYSIQLEKKVMARTQELVLSRQEAIHCLARAGEYRDDDTGHHVTRVGRYARLIAEELGFARERLDLIEQAAQLHDVGKIGIPDAILHKPGKLDPQEFDLMRTHCNVGRKIINPLSHEESIRLTTHTSVGMQIMGSTNSPVLKLAAVIAASHHEKWDGNGYPSGIAGTEIPIEGRIVAVADVFDALSSSRPYKDAFPIEKCLQILLEGRGTHFDPDVLDAFMRRQDEAISIRTEYATD